MAFFRQHPSYRAAIQKSERFQRAEKEMKIFLRAHPDARNPFTTWRP